MSMRVRRLGPVAVALLVGASLLRTSIPLAFGNALVDPTLNLTLSVDEAESSPSSRVWVLSGEPSKNFEAAERVALSRPAKLPDGIRAVALTLKVGGGLPTPILTNAVTIRDLLRAMDIRLARSDVVRPSRRAILRTGLRLRVIQIRRVVETVQEITPFETLIRYSKDLGVDQSQVQEEGAAGLEVRTYRVIYMNGREAGRELLTEEVLSETTSRVILVGPAPEEEPSGGTQYGQASWYDWDICDGPGLTAAHRTIPKGTEVTVTNLDNGRKVTVVINDRGPYGVPGRIIDLCDDAFVQIAPLPQGVADVVITW
ncbi:MAG: G5 domain-containing protein [Actinomycetota bacterium]